MSTMKTRKLKASEVTFEIKIEPEDIEVSGNYMYTDDPEAAREAETKIVDRLNNGYIEAWCSVVVIARWGDFEGSGALGLCSFDTDDLDTQLGDCVESNDMREIALEDLNAKIAATAEALAPLTRKPRKRAKVKSAG